MSDTIYSSEKCMPYIYKGVHKETGQFYFGSRFGEKVYLSKERPSHIDLGRYYFSSSDFIEKLGFENFEWVILAEFFVLDTFSDDAWYQEQKLIFENWGNPLLLNKRYHLGNKWNTTGQNSLKDKSDEEVRLIYEQMTKTKNDRTQEEKDKTDKKRAKTFADKSPEEKAISKKIRSESQINLSDEKKKIKKEKTAKTRSEYTEEKKIEIIKKYIKTKADKSPEEKAKTSKKHSLALKGKKQKIITCPFCKKSGGTTMHRWHFDNCKDNPMNLSIDLIV